MKTTMSAPEFPGAPDIIDDLLPVAAQIADGRVDLCHGNAECSHSVLAKQYSKI